MRRRSKKSDGEGISTVLDISQEQVFKLHQEMWTIGEESVVKDIYCMIKGRYKILWIETKEEDRVINFFDKMAKADNMRLYTWDASRGLVDVKAKQQLAAKDSEVHDNARAVIAHVVDLAKNQQQIYNEDKNTERLGEGDIFLLLDFHLHMKDPQNPSPSLVRLLKEFNRIFSVITLVIVAPEFRCPLTLENELTLIDFPYPSKTEIQQVLSAITSDAVVKFPEVVKDVRSKKEEIIQAATGLTLVETENAFAKSIVKHRTYNINSILDEKRQIIRKSGILQYIQPRFGVDDIGGLDALIEWYKLRRHAFTEEARSFDLPIPKGNLLLGFPGVGKSMVCEALGSLYEMPLLRLDFGAIFGSLVGESEKRMRECIKLVEAVAPTILWIDEVEKAIGIAGNAGVSRNDSGVSSRVFATMLTWMSEKTSLVYVVCTANNVRALPPEFTRSGRFDEIFFLDLPDEEQRQDVARKLIRKYNRDPEYFDLKTIAEHCNNYTPAEMEKGITNALFTAFSEGKRDVLTEDIANELHKFQPMYNSRSDELEELKAWALGDDGQGGMAVKANAISQDRKINVMAPSRRLRLEDNI